MSLAHWDEVDPFVRAAGHIRGTWRDLGVAAGTVGAGVRRVELEPEHWSTPAHVEGADEEIFFLLAGSGLSWQDGQTYEVAAGDCIVHRAGAEAHTLRAGPGGLDYLAYGTRRRAAGTYLPRAGVTWVSPTWVDAGADPQPFDREAAAGPPETPQPSPRPASVVNLGDVPPESEERGGSAFESRDLGRAAGSRATGLNHVTIAPGRLGYPPHCHSADEEIFVVLEGEGALLLGDEAAPVARGHVVGRPPGTRVAHAFRAGPSTPLVLLAYGTREPNDIAYFPRSGKVYLRGIGLVTRLERLDYWEGEE